MESWLDRSTEELPVCENGLPVAVGAALHRYEQHQSLVGGSAYGIGIRPWL